MYEFSLCLTKICRHNHSHWWILRVFHHVLLFLLGLYFGSFRCGQNFSARNGLLLLQGRQCSVKFVTPL